MSYFWKIWKKGMVVGCVRSAMEYDDLSILLPVHRSQFSDGANDIRTRGQSVG